jgi:hypothetical protein
MKPEVRAAHGVGNQPHGGLARELLSVRRDLVVRGV